MKEKAAKEAKHRLGQATKGEAAGADSGKEKPAKKAKVDGFAKVDMQLEALAQRVNTSSGWR